MRLVKYVPNEELAGMLQEFHKYHNQRIGGVSLNGTEGEIRRAETPAELFESIDTDSERIPSFMEIADLRIEAIRELIRSIDGLEELLYQALKYPYDRIRGKSEIAGKLLWEIVGNSAKYGIWQVRLTSSTNMARASDESGRDWVYFFDGNPFADSGELKNAVQGELSDGGLKYSEDALARIVDGHYAKIAFEEYIRARGGNFTAIDFAEHPIFSKAFGNSERALAYSNCLDILSIAGFYHMGIHSGWRPGEMKSGYGRPIALGAVGEAFYPPNNSTVGHAALVLPN